MPLWGVEFIKKELLFLERKSLEKYFRMLVHLHEIGEDVSDELENYLIDFLEGGMNTNEIIDMLGDEGVFDNYATLEEYGVKVDCIEIAKNLGEDFTYRNLGEFNARSVDMTPLAEEVFDKESFCELCETYSATNVFFDFLHCGVEAKVVFNLADELLRAEMEFPSELFDLIDILIRHGLRRNSAKDWLLRRLEADDYNFLEKCSFYYVNELKQIGVNISDFTELYLERYGEDHLTDNSMPLPKWLSMDNLVQHFSMRQIVDDGGLDFIYEFDAKNGDMGMLLQRFVDELGYPSEYKDALILLAMIECGGAKNIDLDKFAESIKTDNLNDEDKRCFRETLSEYGVGAEKLLKFV